MGQRNIDESVRGVGQGTIADCWEVERTARKQLDRFVREFCCGEPLWMDHEKLQQDLWGDWLLVSKATKKVTTVELKAENEWTGNLFLETYSNRDGFMNKLGWLIQGKFDQLFYYFLDTRRLLVLDFPKLREWVKANKSRFKEKEQTRTSQLNKTCGLLVPVKEIPRAALIGDYTINEDGSHGPTCPPPTIPQSPGKESWREVKQGMFN